MFRGVFKYFPKALQAVADISAMGAKKYSWGGWKDSATFADVHRFEDALGRHLLNEHVEGWYDHESNLLHAAHAAWNALAKLELLLGVVPMKDPSSPNANLQKAATELCPKPRCCRDRPAYFQYPKVRGRRTQN